MMEGLPASKEEGVPLALPYKEEGVPHALLRDSRFPEEEENQVPTNRHSGPVRPETRGPSPLVTGEGHHPGMTDVLAASPACQGGYNKRLFP